MAKTKTEYTMDELEELCAEPSDFCGWMAWGHHLEDTLIRDGRGTLTVYLSSPDKNWLVTIVGTHGADMVFHRDNIRISIMRVVPDGLNLWDSDAVHTYEEEVEKFRYHKAMHDKIFAFEFDKELYIRPSYFVGELPDLKALDGYIEALTMLRSATPAIQYVLKIYFKVSHK